MATIRRWRCSHRGPARRRSVTSRVASRYVDDFTISSVSGLSGDALIAAARRAAAEFELELNHDKSAVVATSTYLGNGWKHVARGHRPPSPYALDDFKRFFYEVARLGRELPDTNIEKWALQNARVAFLGADTGDWARLQSHLVNAYRRNSTLIALLVELLIERHRGRGDVDVEGVRDFLDHRIPALALEDRTGELIWLLFLMIALEIEIAARRFERLYSLEEPSARSTDSIRSVVPIELLAAGAYQLGGLPAMASGLLSQVRSDHVGVRLYSAFLRADFDGVLWRAAQFWLHHPDLTTADAGVRLLTAMRDEVGEEEAGPTVAWTFSVELVRSLKLIADCLRRGDDERLGIAIDKLHALDAMATRTFSDDASLVITIMRDVADSFVAATIYRPLRALGGLRPELGPRLLAYARDQFSRGRGILWTSQQHGLQRLLEESSFALCTPTGSGKTLVANLALIKELLLREHDGLPGPLALYIVPSRALAGEVEAKLTSELGRDITVTELYGRADWGITDYWLTSEQPVVLIATVEKAEVLMRYLGQMLMARLSLLIIDEAHHVVPEANEATRISFSDHSNRSIRLEGLVSRILSQRPDVVRIALTAVAGGAAGPVARWVEGRPNASQVGLRYRSTRQIIGVLETAPNTQGRILLDLMNGLPLYLRDEEDPVYLRLQIEVMPQLPAQWRNSLNRFNCLSVLWTALHLADEDQRVLISVAQELEQTMRWYKEALVRPDWQGGMRFQRPEGQLRVRFDEARAACLDYCGADSFELFLIDRGIATNHGQMPQRLRRLMVDLIDLKICPITVATSTLTEGVNLPFDLIFLTSLKRRSWDSVEEWPVIAPLTTAEFRNLAGRAGRPGAARGIEGMTLVALSTQISTTAAAGKATQRRQRSELSADYDRLRASLVIEERDSDDVPSPLALLLNRIWERANRLLGVAPDAFLDWLDRTAPTVVSADAGTGASGGAARLADAMDDLDSILLTSLEEIARADEADMTRARAEAQLTALWNHLHRCGDRAGSMARRSLRATGGGYHRPHLSRRRRAPSPLSVRAAAGRGAEV